MPTRDRTDLGAERPHPEHVRRLAPDVLLAHEHDARQAEQRARGRGRDAVLAGAGLGDDPRLAEPPGEQRLAERVVDLVGPGVGEVLALEVEADRGDRRAPRAPLARRRAASTRASAQAVGAVQRRRPAGVPREQVVELGPEAGVVAERVVGRLELLERRHERLGHVATAEVALLAPAPGAVDVEQPRMDGRRPERRVGPVAPGVPGPLREQRDPQRVLARPLAGDPRRVRARGDVDADGGDREQRVTDVARMEPAGERDRDLAGDRGGERRRRPASRSHPGAGRRRRRAGSASHRPPR